ncbi:MAG: hypothetical protein CMG66_02545 [Candidatus Marinimicrobia bacterium]|nr:hypothetical protein [Candidatus Neomarinimicrobiota bacterium]|tara:strand:+ start:5640 stop:6644 length:1005 start_codon:yes stop_codon:yes gene_type:complete
MIKYFLYIILFYSFCFAQWFDLNYQGTNRTYYVAYPNNSSSPAGLIINMHGFGGTAASQISGTQMNSYAHPENLAVVYPQGANSSIGTTSWNVGTFWDFSTQDDVGFLSAVIDDIASNFDINLNRVYACGFSNGGYMAYELACELSDRITAFGSVAGNFMLNSNQQCDNDREIPIIHFHGTNDPTVDYSPPSFDQALTVSESIDYWSDFNNLDLEFYESLNSNVEIYTYFKESSPTQFVHYKVNGGQHEWFWNNWGFNASEELVNFFSQYELTDFINNVLLGDLNQDYNINIQDIILIVNLILDVGYSDLADMNFDGYVDVIDIVQLVNIILTN